jgi:LacI family transcriptional regulator
MPDGRGKGSKGSKGSPPSDGGQERVTLADVARIAGVSLATASRALGSGPRMPRAELTARVRQVAAELHFVPNPAAQAVARGRAAVVGLILHDISDPYFATIASVVLEAAEAEGLMAVIADARRDHKRELRYVTSFRHQRVRAIIVAGSRTGNQESKAALQRQIHLYIEEGGRLALISQPELDANTVSVRNREASEALAVALCGCGYRDFAVLAGAATLRTSTDRLEGFRAGLKAAGFALHANRVYRAEFSRDGGFESAVTMMNEGTLPECIFAVNDVMALGAMAAFRAAGLRVPGDVAVAGFDDVATLRDIVPALTTVHIPVEQVAAEAVDMVLRAGEDRSLRRTVDGIVMLRESTPARVGEEIR